MQTIDKNYSKPLKDKITRILLYILNFGYHVIKINEQGNVLIRNHLLGPESNILDLLQGSVTSCATKPVGFQQFRKSLVEINVPKNLLAESRVKSDKQTAEPSRVFDILILKVTIRKILDGKHTENNEETDVSL